MPKQLIREKILALRRGYALDGCRLLGRRIQEQFLATADFARAASVALYSPVQNEVGTEMVAAAVISAGKVLAYPRVVGREMEFVRTVDPVMLRPGYLNVSEPCSGQVMLPEEIDLCVVPGVAFDLDGHRLGYGKGFYDRFLSQLPNGVVRIGFAYDFQVVEALPVQSHDQRLSMLITEKRILRFPACPPDELGRSADQHIHVSGGGGDFE